MDITDLSVGDRIEVYTPSTGTYWGFITAIGDDHVTLEDIAPDPRGKDLTRAAVADVVRKVPRPWRGWPTRPDL